MSERNSTCSSRSPLGNLDGAYIGEGHAHVLRLPPGIAAAKVRVAEQAGAAVRSCRLAGAAFGLVLSHSDHRLFLAKETLAAADGKRHHHAVTLHQVLDVAADLEHLAHEFMAEDVALRMVGM